MFWSAKPTIDADDEEWQIACWQWLLDNLGGIEALLSFETATPTHADFPKSGLTGHAHVEHVLGQVAERMRIDPSQFTLAAQEAGIDPVLSPLAVVKNAPAGPLGTYSADGNAHIITYEPEAARDLEQLIATLVHEICHPILLSIPDPPPGEETEEYATDLATVFFGFGLFGGNSSFKFNQFRDDASGTQGWSTSRAGYLSQNEWGFALAVRSILTGEDPGPVERHASTGLLENFRKNLRYLTKKPEALSAFR